MALSDYKRLSFVRCDGSSYINTGIYPKTTTKVECDFQLESLDNSRYVFGWAASNNKHALFINTLSGYIREAYSASYQTVATVETDKAKHKAVLAPKNQSIDGVQYGQLEMASAASSSQTMYLGACRIGWGSGVSSGMIGKIYGMKIYDGDVLVRDFIPAMRIADDVVGFYDIVNDTFYTNAGSGTFTGYTEVEYLRSDGSSVIDTGFVPNEKSAAYIDVSMSTLIATTVLFGSRVAQKNKAFNIFLLDTGARTRFDMGTVQQNESVSFANNARHTLKLDKGDCYVDGELKDSYSVEAFSGAYSVALFGIKEGTSQYNYLHEKTIYAFKAWDNGALVRDMLPIVRSDGEAGMYDHENGVFYANAGTGSFAYGNEAVPYLDYVSGELVEKTAYPTKMDSSTTALTAGWWAVDTDITQATRISCTGDVHLILCDGCTLTASEGISVNATNNHTLTIYAQSEDASKGAIEADASTGAAIGGNASNSSGTTTINGGSIKAEITTANNFSAGIGGGLGGRGNIIINAGDITATSAGIGAAIGSGQNATGGEIVINGGNISAVVNQISSDNGAAGIGGGWRGHANVTINGGTIVAQGSPHGAGIGHGGRSNSTSGGNVGGNITIAGGTIEARSVYAAGIGGGAYSNGGDINVSSITITGGTITASSIKGIASAGLTIDWADADGITHKPSITCGSYNISALNEQKEFYKTKAVLPAQYRAVEYIETVDRNYINTGVLVSGAALTAGLILETKTAFYTAANRQAIGKNANPYFFYGINTNGVFYAGCGSNYAASSVSVDTSPHVFKIDSAAKVVSLDGTQIIDLSSSNYNGTSDANIYLGNIMGSGTNYTVEARIYDAKIWSAGVLIRDYVPCYRIADGVIGVYDLVNDTFTAGQTTSGFTSEWAKGSDTDIEVTKDKLNALTEPYIVEPRFTQVKVDYDESTIASIPLYDTTKRRLACKDKTAKTDIVVTAHEASGKSVVYGETVTALADGIYTMSCEGLYMTDDVLVG